MRYLKVLVLAVVFTLMSSTLTSFAEEKMGTQTEDQSKDKSEQDCQLTTSPKQDIKQTSNQDKDNKKRYELYIDDKKEKDSITITITKPSILKLTAVNNGEITVYFNQDMIEPQNGDYKFDEVSPGQYSFHLGASRSSYGDDKKRCSANAYIEYEELTEEKTKEYKLYINDKYIFTTSDSSKLMKKAMNAIEKTIAKKGYQVKINVQKDFHSNVKGDWWKLEDKDYGNEDED